MIRIVDILKRVEAEAANNITAAPLPTDKRPPVSEPSPQAKALPVENASVVQKPVENSVEKPEDTPFIFEELLTPLTSLLAQKVAGPSAKEDGKKIWQAIEHLVERQCGGTPDLLVQLEQQTKGKSAFNHSLKIMINSLKLGKDSNYDQRQLCELALGAIIQDLELSNFVAALNLPLLKETLRPYADFSAAAYLQIINLSEIYDLNTQA